MATKFNPPPGWPVPPAGWFPPAGWLPDESWPVPPAGWQFLVEEPDEVETSAPLPVPWVAGAPAEPLTATLLPPPTPQHPAPQSSAPQPPALDPGVIWAAKGQPLTGIGAGRYQLTATMLFFEKGMLSTRAQQVPIAHVVDVDMRQSISQKARNVGNVLVHVQRANGIELVVLEDVPDPRAGVTVINTTAHAARLVDQQRQNTHHYANVAPMVPPAALVSPGAPAPAATADPIDQLRRLGELRDAGIVTEAEFAAKKAEILARL